MITERMHGKMLDGAKMLAKKHKETLITKMMPVTIEVAESLGLEVDPKAIAAAKKADVGTQVNTIVKMADYIKAVEAFEPETEDEPEDAEETETETDSGPNNDPGPAGPTTPNA